MVSWAISKVEESDTIYLHIYIYIIWLFNIAMENGPFIDDFSIKPPFMRDFPWLC